MADFVALQVFCRCAHAAWFMASCRVDLACTPKAVWLQCVAFGRPAVLAKPCGYSVLHLVSLHFQLNLVVAVCCVWSALTPRKTKGLQSVALGRPAILAELCSCSVWHWVGTVLTKPCARNVLHLVGQRCVWADLAHAVMD